jgi:YVTN family beta-propeller protein
VIHAGTEGNALSVDVKANKIYFVGYEDNFLTVVDGVTNEPARIEVPGFHQWDSAFNETNGLLYLPTPNNDALTVIDTRANVVSTVGTGRVPMAAAVNEVTDRIYVVNYGSSDVTVVDGPTNRAIATVKVGLWPQQVAIDTKTNMIYVVNTHANSVSVIDGRTNAVAATVPTDKGPWAVAVDPVTNMIYVANRLSDKVTVIDGRTNKAVQR